MEIKHTGIVAEQPRYKYAVKQNNKSNIIIFKFSKQQDSIVLDPNKHFYVKVRNSGRTFTDKDPNVAVTSTDNDVIISWTMLRKVTQFKDIDVQVQYEDTQNDIVWQSAMVNINLFDNIPADQEIEDLYPSILMKLQKQIDELKVNIQPPVGGHGIHVALIDGKHVVSIDENVVQEKEEGKGLSSNDYTNEDKEAVSEIPNKVDKIAGKGLSSNDFTDEDKSKLDSTVFYDVISEIIPHKGDIIKIENNRYRVLEENNGIVKLYALFDIGESIFNNSISDGNVYEGSVLDTFINNWFNNQSITFKNACVESIITQRTYEYSILASTSWDFKYYNNWSHSTPRFAIKTVETSSFTRKVYAPSIEDYFEYHESNETTSNDLMKFFFEGDGKKGSYANKFLWLRFAIANYSDFAGSALGSVGSLSQGDVRVALAVHPLCYINLSKIDWEFSE